MHDEGEPLSNGQIDRRAEDARTRRTAAFAVAFFAGVVLVNGILVILVIALLQALGLWSGGTIETTSVSVESTDEVRSLLATFVPRPATPSVAA